MRVKLNYFVQRIRYVRKKINRVLSSPRHSHVTPHFEGETPPPASALEGLCEKHCRSSRQEFETRSLNPTCCLLMPATSTLAAAIMLNPACPKFKIPCQCSSTPHSYVKGYSKHFDCSYGIAIKTFSQPNQTCLTLESPTPS